MGAGSKRPASLTGSNTNTYGSGDSLDPNLKYDTTGPTPIVLIPQPSDDPNDPLVGYITHRIANGIGLLVGC